MRAERFKNRTVAPSAVRVAARAPHWLIPAVKVGLVVADVFIAVFAFISAFYIRHSEAIFARSASGGLTWSRQFAPYGALLLIDRKSTRLNSSHESTSRMPSSA